MSLTTGRR